MVELAELQTRISFDRNRDGVVSDDEALYFLDEQTEANLETFVQVCWPRIKPFLMLDSGLFVPPTAAPVDIEAPEKHDDDEQQLLDDDLDEHHLLDDGEEAVDEEEEYEEETGEGEVCCWDNYKK